MGSDAAGKGRPEVTGASSSAPGAAETEAALAALAALAASARAVSRRVNARGDLGEDSVEDMPSSAKTSLGSTCPAPFPRPGPAPVGPAPCLACALGRLIRVAPSVCCAGDQLGDLPLPCGGSSAPADEPPGPPGACAAAGRASRGAACEEASREGWNDEKAPANRAKKGRFCSAWDASICAHQQERGGGEEVVKLRALTRCPTKLAEQGAGRSHGNRTCAYLGHGEFGGMGYASKQVRHRGDLSLEAFKRDFCPPQVIDLFLELLE